MTVICKNCDYHYKGKFCPQCGQKASVKRLTVGHVLHEFWHNFTHTDKSVLHLLKLLIVNPGMVIRDYIEGKRARYFNPFTFFLLVTSILILVTKYVFEYEDELYKLNNEYGYYTSSNVNIIIFCMLPLMALLLKLLFLEKKINYAESVTVLIFCFSLANFFQLITNLLYIPLISLHYTTSGYVYIISYMFVAWGLISFARPKNVFGYFKCIIAALIFYLLVEQLGKGLALWYGGVPFDKIFN